MKEEVKIFVYGSCHFSERIDNTAIGNGGYGIVININGIKHEELSDGFSSTTNARMDIIGITEGLKKIKQPSHIIIYLTNQYVIDTLNKGWLEKWKLNGFKKIKHTDLWIELDKVICANSHEISFKHSKEVSSSKEFQIAEQLGKAMSSKKNLPHDLAKANENTAQLFVVAEEEPVIDENIETADDKPILESFSVDASAIQNPGPTEYRCVNTQTKEEIFRIRLSEATNNIGEFLAIVHALAHFKRSGKDAKIIYSDSLNAISWVQQKKCKTKYQRNENNTKVFEMIERAIIWLNTNSYETKILKWNTALWGEIPADFGRK
jgi:ribonuclease HI